MNAAYERARPPLPEGPYLVVGLARSGLSAARLLSAHGGQVLACDSGRPEGVDALTELGVEVFTGTDGLELLQRAKAVIKSPGVPAEAPVIAAARERGTEVIGELELAWRAIPNPFCAVTGTNGKTTTVELLGHIWRSAGAPVAVAGNVGTALSSLAGQVDPDTTVICEASSFQLEDSTLFAPECAVMLNVAPDHLDRHGSFEAYLDAKLRIFANQGNDDDAVYNASQPELRDRDLGGCARRVPFCPDGSAADPDCAVSRRDDVIFAGDEPLVEVGVLKLLGSHNVENAMGAAGAALAMGLDRETVAEALASFGGVAHRLEIVAERDGVTWVNDSKATNVGAAIAGLSAFDGGVHLIAGGSLKGESYVPLAGPVAERAREVLLIGEAAEQLGRELAPAAEAGVGVEQAGTLERAVELAAERARPGDVVLLSPACASFDAFTDFEARGDRFRELVGGLR